jgi:hypothetical protein
MYNNENNPLCFQLLLVVMNAFHLNFLLSILGREAVSLY